MVRKIDLRRPLIVLLKLWRASISHLWRISSYQRMDMECQHMTTIKFSTCQAIICYQLTKYEITIRNQEITIIKYEFLEVARTSSWRHQMTTIMFSTLAGYHMLSTDQVLSQTSIRKYDFQKNAATSLWRHQKIAIMFSTLSGYHIL